MFNKKRIAELELQVKKLTDENLILTKQQSDRFPLATKYPVVPAFFLDGIQYFQYEDPFNTPFERGFSAIDYYNELSQRCSREFLVYFSQAIDDVLNSPGNVVKFVRIAELNKSLKDRLAWIVVKQMAMKLAAVIYFDANEDPTTFDMKYAEKKMLRWEKNPGVTAFFLQEPLIKLIPYLKGLEFNIEEYSEVTEKLTKEHLKLISSLLSDEKMKSDLNKAFGLSPTEMQASSNHSDRED